MRIYDGDCWWDDRVDYYDDDPLTCPRCDGVLTVDRYKYGEDSDGNRGEWRTDVECGACDWTPADGEVFDRCDECGRWIELCECTQTDESIDEADKEEYD